jgi:hypothetical protein
VERAAPLASDGAKSRQAPEPPVEPAPTLCDICGSSDLAEIRCKVICRNCKTILQSCADL